MKNRQLSKYLSLLLRHQPEILDLKMDPEGWVDLKELLAKLQASGKQVHIEDIQYVVENNDKKRFKINDHQTHIRANQGHSVNINLQLLPQVPPKTLFHGTAIKNLEAIQANGLQKMNRQHVHLSSNLETAQKVGQRHGKVVVLTIKSLNMQEQGFQFFLSENGVWLTDHVPVEFVKF